MNEPTWIDADDCLAFQNELLSWFGGPAGVRAQGMLESALGRPRQRYAHASPPIYELAAAYGFGIVKNHPFVDGNKRAGFLAAALFLEANGERFSASEEEVVVQTVALASGDCTEAEYAAWLKDSCQRPAQTPHE